MGYAKLVLSLKAEKCTLKGKPRNSLVNTLRKGIKVNLGRSRVIAPRKGCITLPRQNAEIGAHLGI